MRFALLALLTTYAAGAAVPAARRQTEPETGLLTIQRFKMSDSSPEAQAAVVTAMKDFQESEDGISHSYYGFYTPEGTTDFLATQFFLVEDSEVDLATPFLEFSATPELEQYTALMANKTGLIAGLPAEGTEVIITYAKPEVDISQAHEDMAVVGALTTLGVGNGGGSYGFGDDRLTFVVIGWETPQYGIDWVNSLEGEDREALNTVVSEYYQNASGAPMPKRFIHTFSPV